MRRLLLSLILALLATGAVKAQSTAVSGTVTDTGSQAWAFGTYTFKSASPQEPIITGTLDINGSFTSVTIPHDQFTASVSEAWTFSFCPDVSIPSSGSGCYNQNVTIQGPTQTITGLSPPAPALTIPVYPGAIGTIRAYNDAEIVSAPKGAVYFNVITLVERICIATGGTPTAPTCTTWTNNGGGSGPGGTILFNQILNPNDNTFLNFGGTTATFNNGTFNFTNFNFIIPATPTFIPSASSNIGINTTVNNFRIWNGVEATEALLAPLSNNYTDGDFLTVHNVAGHLTAVSTPPNPTSGTGPLNVTITNPAIDDSFCISSLGPPIQVVNCTEGVPITTISATTYTIDCSTDRGTYLVFTASSPISVTLPQAAVSGACSANFFTYIRTLNADLTVTPTISTINDGGGAGATLVIHPGYGTNIFSDDTNYVAKVGPFRKNPFPLYDSEGYDIGTIGVYQWQEPNASPATVLNKMACPNGSGQVIICAAASAATNNPDGVAVNGVGAAPGSTGNTGICSFGYCTVFFDNTATGNHYAQLSTTQDGMLRDVGTSRPTNGQPYWHVWTANSGANTTGVVRILTSDELNATGNNGGGKTTVMVNGVQAQPQANLQDAVSGCTTWSAANSGNQTNIGAHVCHGLSFTIGDPGASSGLTVANTTTAYLTVPFACTLNAYNLAIDAGTITVKFWKIATGTAIPTSSNSINTSGVGISSGTAIHSATMTDFTSTAVAANDIMAMNVTAVATAKYVNGVLSCKE